jgi:cellobionic acid phosphorylase
MIPGPELADYQQRGQLPVFIPNYYRGAYRQHPRKAGRSSQLVHTGTVSWFYRCLVEGLFGLQGDRQGLLIQPQLPSHWHEVRVTRAFRGATFDVHVHREPDVANTQVAVDGQPLPTQRLTRFQAGRTYQVQVSIPA